MRRLIAAATLFAALASWPTPGRAQDPTVRERALPHYRTAWGYMRAEAWPDAQHAFQLAIDVDQKFELAYYGLGQALMAQKRFVEAAAAYLRCRDLYQAQSGRLFTNAQDAQRYRRDRIAELDELIRQVQSGPMTVQMQDRLRQLHEQRRQIQELLQRGGNITIENTVPSFVSLALGSAYFRSNKLADAEREYKAAINADARAGEAHNNLAVVYLMTGRAEDADKEVKAAERAGFKVQPGLKNDIREAKKNGTN